VLLPGALAVVARFRTQPFDLRPALGTRLLDVVPQLVGVGGSTGGATAGDSLGAACASSAGSTAVASDDASRRPRSQKRADGCRRME